MRCQCSCKSPKIEATTALLRIHEFFHEYQSAFYNLQVNTDVIAHQSQHSKTNPVLWHNYCTEGSQVSEECYEFPRCKLNREDSNSLPFQIYIRRLGFAYCAEIARTTLEKSTHNTSTLSVHSMVWRGTRNGFTFFISERGQLLNFYIFILFFYINSHAIMALLISSSITSY